MLLAGVSPAALADNSSQPVIAQVYRQGQSAPTTDQTTIGALEQSCQTYAGPQNVELYGSNGTPAPAQSIGSGTAWTIGSVLGCLPTSITPAEAQQVIVFKQGGSDPELGRNSVLGPGYLTAPGSQFNNPQEAPVIYTDGTNIDYIRPWRGPGDVNVSDLFTDSGPSTPFEMEVFEGSPLSVTLAPSGKSVSAGTTVTFTASAAGTTATYSWYLNGQQQSGTASTLKLPFSSAAIYQVTVQAIGADGGTGTAEATVTVTSAHQSPAKQSSHPSHTGSTTAPRGGRGGTGTGKTGHTGTATGTGHGTGASATKGSSASGAAGAGSPASTGAGAGSGAPASPATHPSAATHTHPSTAQDRGQAAHRANPAAGRHPGPVTAPFTTQVSGRVIGQVTPLPASESPLVHTVPARLGTAQQLTRPLAPSPLPALAAGAAVIALFGLGVRRELRGRARARLRFGS